MQGKKRASKANGRTVRPAEADMKSIRIACGKKNGRSRRTRHDLAMGRADASRSLRSPPPSDAVTAYSLCDELIGLKPHAERRRKRCRLSRPQKRLVSLKFSELL